jgi:DNA-directed RNA polymerase subunit RPC12/RpoP
MSSCYCQEWTATVVYNEQMSGYVCSECGQPAGFDMDDSDDDDYHNTDPNVCSECGDNTVQVQNGSWVCPGCDLWLY